MRTKAAVRAVLDVGEPSGHSVFRDNCREQGLSPPISECDEFQFWRLLKTDQRFERQIREVTLRTQTECSRQLDPVPSGEVLPHRQRSRISCRKCSGAAFISSKSIVKTGCESGVYTMVTPSTQHGDTIRHHGVLSCRLRIDSGCSTYHLPEPWLPTLSQRVVNVCALAGGGTIAPHANRWRFGLFAASRRRRSN